MSFDKIFAKSEVERLVKKLNDIKASGRLKTYNEESTKKDFITPLFRALGWDVENSKSLDEVTNEDRVSKGRVDYAFRKNGIPKFFLEAKALNVGLDEVKDSSQAISYAWYKNTTWAVLTDFQTLIIYNAEVKGKSLSDAQFIRFTYDQFEDNFEKLCWLSEPAFLEGRLDKEATSWGKKLIKTKVNEQLLSELVYYRTILSKDIVKQNASKNLTEEQIDESVQRIIDRLIFIRTTEDRGIEPPTLRPLVREFGDKKRGHITDGLNKIYSEYDESYNSKLFTNNLLDLSKRHLCEALTIENDVLIEIINGLYTSRDGFKNYDFSAIDADVLGNIYEQYLSHILKKTEKRAKVESKEAHRKEQGIYYTPTYIVDYIVRNTLGEIIKNKKPNDVDKIKVLDMACGSGSFLLKSFDILDEYYSKQNKKHYEQYKLDGKSDAIQITRKTTILRNNLYGVDLDTKAVEIAQLNLLLKAAETKHRLPDLRENIKCGNSLIDDATTAGELALDWNKEFPEIMKEGGFDVIIGNPPYVFSRNYISESEKEYYSNKYQVFEYQSDLYILFIEQAILKARSGGKIGLIIPNAWLGNLRTKKIRQYLLENTTIQTVVYCPKETFGISVETVIIIMRKGAKKTRNEIAIFEYDRAKNIKKCDSILQKTIEDDPEKRFNLRAGSNNLGIIKKIEQKSMKLEDYCDITRGVNAYDKYRGQSEEIIKNRAYHSDHKIDSSYIPELRGKNVGRYYYSWEGDSWIKYGKWLAAPRDPRFFTGKRIILRQIPSKKLVVTIINEDFCIDQTVFIAKPKNNDVKLEYLLGIVASSLMSYYFKFRNEELDEVFPKVKLENFKELPIKISEKQSEIVSLVEKMLTLNQSLVKLKDKQTDEKDRLEKEFAEIDLKIDRLVYDVYGLTEEERRLVDEAVK